MSPPQRDRFNNVAQRDENRYNRKLNTEMRLRFGFFITICLVSVFFLAGKTYGQEGRIARVHGFIGVNIPSDRNIASGLWSSIGFSIPVDRAFFLAFDFGYWTSDITGSADSLLDGTLYVNPFLVSVQYVLFPDSILTPYISLGGGFVFSSFKIGNILTIPEIHISQKIENGPGGKLSAGLELDVRKNLSIVGEVSYLLRRTKGMSTIQDMNFGSSTDEFSVNLSSLILHLGLRYTLGGGHLK